MVWTHPLNQFFFSRVRRPALRFLPWLALPALALAASAQTAPGGANSVPAPELVGKAWLNLTNGGSLSLAARKGKVTVLHFWTFDCINCKHNLPHYLAWRRRFASQGLEVIGIHTPETDSERDPANVAKRLKELRVDYPVLLDPDRRNWDRWQQRYWPAIYLIDKRGRARCCWEGELEYPYAGGFARMTSLIEQLLRE